MVAILDAVGVERAVIGGHSLGGYLSLRFHLLQRHRVAGLVLIDTGPGYRQDAARDGWNTDGRELRGQLRAPAVSTPWARAPRCSGDVHRDAPG